MKVTVDSKGGSTYVILFQDRGDVLLEKSYVRLGGTGIKVLRATILPNPDETLIKEEYRVSIKFVSGNTEHETIIPVIDGHFSTEGVINN
jgi:hypothetical protein